MIADASPSALGEALEARVARYLAGVEPSVLGLPGPSRFEVSELGAGDSNLNFLAAAGRARYVVRIDMHPELPGKSREEFHNLRLLDGLGLAPKAYLLEEDVRHLGGSFIVVEHFEGERLDVAKRRFTEEDSRELARMVAEVHLADIRATSSRFRPDALEPASLLPRIVRRVDGIREYRGQRPGDAFDDILLSGLEGAAKSTGGFTGGVRTLGHGDICEENIVVDGGRMRLIDWEDVCLTDPAAEVAGIFIGFGGLGATLDSRGFMAEYLEHRPDATMAERVAAFSHVIRFGHMAWHVRDAFEGLKGAKHGELLKRGDAEADVSTAMELLRKCADTGVVDRRALALSREDVFGA